MTERVQILLAVLLGVLVSALPASLCAQGASESHLFSAGLKEFEDGSYGLAEKQLADFISAFPQSTHIPEAILYQARAALKQQKFGAAVGLLSTNAANAGALADQYRYHLAEAQLQSADYQAAASTFASVIKEFTNSNHLLAASYGEAVARFRLKDWTRAIELLQQPTGVFYKEAVLRPADELATRGALLLAEALIEHKEYAAAQARLIAMAEGDLIPEFRWRRQYLLCRTEVADHRPAEALANTTNLLVLAIAASDRNFLAESVALQGSILQQLGRVGEASLAYEKNLADTVPAESARQALLKITALMLARNKVAEAGQKLELFLAKHPDDAGSDVALLTLGELHLRQHFAGLETNRTDAVTNAALMVTNHLQQALLAFERVVTNYPNSPLAGRALLDKGWGLWADGKIPLSQAAFQLAAEQLPHSEEQAVARFKLAEVQFFQNDYTNALLNFRSVLHDFSDLTAVKEALYDQALYQIARASLKLGDLAGANEAMKQILEWYPKSSFGDRLMLLIGQHLTASKRPAEARQVFQDLVRQFPDSVLTPEIEFAIARTYVQENDWLAAIVQYEGWLNRFPTNGLRPDVEFHRALATFRAGNETNALALFTNLSARFPTNDMAALAQLSAGFIYFDQENFVSAEKTFQEKVLLLNTNYSYQALMMAGRAAYARQGYSDAEKYFRTLVNDNNCPPDFKAQAWFELGDTFTAKAPDSGKRLEKYVEAIPVFNKIPSLFPDSPLVPRAWGRIGDCYYQLATEDAKQYDNATNSYQKVILAPAADVGARSQAEVGIGVALEAMATAPKAAPEILEAASGHYASVLYETNLRDGEAADPFWLERAGLAAGKLAERRQQWQVAIKIYKRLETKLPPLHDLLEKRIDAARAEQLRLEENDYPLTVPVCFDTLLHMDTSEAQTESVVRLTENAASHVKEMLTQEPENAGKALRVYVEDGGCSGLQYGLTFDQKRDNDLAADWFGVSVYVDPFSANYLQGTVIDFSDSLTGGGFKISNPKARQSCGCGKSFGT